LDVGAGFQLRILAGEQSSLLTRLRGDGQRFIVRADEKLSALVELESAVRAAANCLD